MSAQSLRDKERLQEKIERERDRESLTIKYQYVFYSLMEIEYEGCYYNVIGLS